jgi:hypothetical protein
MKKTTTAPAPETNPSPSDSSPGSSLSPATGEHLERDIINWAVPAELDIEPDPVRLRIDFGHQSVKMTFFDADVVITKMVSAMDIAHALASELSFSTGFLPPGTLWWRNTKEGPVFAIYEEPRIRKLALQDDVSKPVRRFEIPMPGLIFLCSPGKPPWVYAVKKRPIRETDSVYHAPLANIFSNGRSCPGSHKYPSRVKDMVNSFFLSFFSATADLRGRSAKFPQNVIHLWEFLDKKKRYPKDDLIKAATIKDLMEMEMHL